MSLFLLSWVADFVGTHTGDEIQCSLWCCCICRCQGFDWILVPKLPWVSLTLVLSFPLPNLFKNCTELFEAGLSYVQKSGQMFNFIRCKVYSFADGEQKLWTEGECNLVQSWEMEWVRGFWIVCSSNSRWTQTSTHLQRPRQLFILLRFGLHLFVVYSVEFSVLWLQMLF